jgi:hypothetical protein
MKIQVTMDQQAITEAIRDYVVKNGMTSPVQDVEFTVTRKGGTSISAEVILGNDAVTTGVDQAKPGTDKTAVSKRPPAPRKTTEPVAQPEPVKEPEPEAAEVAAPVEEPVPAEAEEKPPFDVDEPAENDSVEDEPAKSKKLFG